MLFLKRITVFLVAVAIVVLSITISGLNTEKVFIDLYYKSFEVSLGFSLILTLFLGLLIGLLLALFGFYMPLKSRISKLSRKNRELLAQKRLELNND